MFGRAIARRQRRRYRTALRRSWPPGDSGQGCHQPSAPVTLRRSPAARRCFDLLGDVLTDVENCRGHTPLWCMPLCRRHCASAATANARPRLAPSAIGPATSAKLGWPRIRDGGFCPCKELCCTGIRRPSGLPEDPNSSRQARNALAPRRAFRHSLKRQG